LLKTLKGILKCGIVTEGPGTWGEGPGRGLPVVDAGACPPGCRRCQEACPTGAMTGETVDPGACIYCHCCREACPGKAVSEIQVPVIATETQTETQKENDLIRRLKKVCRKSLHIRYVDAGACNGCDFEINSLTGPHYDIQQYGFDFVASPRHADMLLITGVVSRNMEIALQKTYEACPRPALVVAVGACACGGGVFRGAYASGGGVAKHLPVDVSVPGCPPTPALIMQGILKAVDRL